MIAILSGGTGTPKLIQGLLEIVGEEQLSVIVNTAEDHWLDHGYISPDIDTVVYTIAGVVDDSTWHGIKGDTYYSHEALKTLGSSEYLKIGDRDRALHIWRGERLRAGETLSQVTKAHCKTIGVKANVGPMSDDTVESAIETIEGDMSLHEFWVKNKGTPEVKGVRFKGLDNAEACKEAIDAIDEAKRIIVGPSNPVTSIYPIISLQGIRKSLERNRKKVVGISPIIGNTAFSGPAEKLMHAFGIEVSVEGVAKFYKDLMDRLVVDSSETVEDEPVDVKILKTNIVMDTREKRKALAKFVMDV
jgi:LPPG:FO 2-phospho-L-lactate transferase